MDALTGQIGLIPHPTSWVTRGIQWVTNSDVHHVVIHVGNGQVIGANPDGAAISAVDLWPDAIWSRFAFTPAQAQACADWARAREGRPYNYVDCAVIWWECLTKRSAPKWLENRLDDDKYYECAQLADAALTHGAGITVFDDGRPPGTVYPGSFEQLFKAKGWWPHDFK